MPGSYERGSLCPRVDCPPSRGRGPSTRAPLRHEGRSAAAGSEIALSPMAAHRTRETHNTLPGHHLLFPGGPDPSAEATTYVNTSHLGGFMSMSIHYAG